MNREQETGNREQGTTVNSEGETHQCQTNRGPQDGPSSAFAIEHLTRVEDAFVGSALIRAVVVVAHAVAGCHNGCT